MNEKKIKKFHSFCWQERFLKFWKIGSVKERIESQSSGEMVKRYFFTYIGVVFIFRSTIFTNLFIFSSQMHFKMSLEVKQREEKNSAMKSMMKKNI